MFKLSFRRGKDWVDLEAMVQTVRNLDEPYVTATLLELRGPTMHPRLARFRAMAAVARTARKLRGWDSNPEPSD